MTKISKIIFLIEYPFNQRDYEKFGIDIFIQDGFDVYIWDFTPFLYPEVNQRVNVSDPIAYEKIRQFMKKKKRYPLFKMNPIIPFLYFH